MRFRPDGGIHQQPQHSAKATRAALEARSAAESEDAESVFNTRRYESEIERAEARVADAEAASAAPAAGQAGQTPGAGSPEAGGENAPSTDAVPNGPVGEGVDSAPEAAEGPA